MAEESWVVRGHLLSRDGGDSLPFLVAIQGDAAHALNVAENLAFDAAVEAGYRVGRVSLPEAAQLLWTTEAPQLFTGPECSTWDNADLDEQLRLRQQDDGDH
jgi:hypothetical protein